jgi:hypothetical protein
VSLLVSLLLLGLVVLLAVRSVGGLLRWLGGPVLASGLIAAALALLGLINVDRTLAGSIAGGGMAPSVAEVAVQLATSLARHYLTLLLVGGIALAAVGMALLAAAAFTVAPATSYRRS